MQWLDRFMDKWNAMMEKIRPGFARFAEICRKVGKKLATFWKYIYMLRSIILAAPLAAAAVILASINMRRLPASVSVVTFTFDTGDPDALFGFLSMYPQIVARELAVFVPLVVTALSILMMLLSKRTLYPFFVALMTLSLPLFIWFFNAYPL